VQQIVQLIGDRNPIYQSSERAKDYSFETIPLPPTMPMMAYKWLAPQWELQHPIIHDKIYDYKELPDKESGRCDNCGKHILNLE
jgi:hypothetical protein